MPNDRILTATCLLTALILGATLLLRGPARLSRRAESILVGSAAGLALAAAAVSYRSRRRDAGTEGQAPPGGPAPEPGSSDLDSSYPIIFHEIKNYASTLKGNTDLLRKNLPAGQAGENLDRLERATQRIARLAREVLDVSLIGKPGERHEVDLDGLVRDCSNAYFDGLAMGFKFMRDRAELRILGDEGKLEQVFLNLFKNSLEAGATLVQVNLIAQRERITVILEDDGVGCTTEQVGRMFDAYHSFKRGHGGTGLGLFLVKAIVEGHGGTISAVSKNEKEAGARGMLFVLNFPRIRDIRPDGLLP
jgi:signal transduction histidine kinase